MEITTTVKTIANPITAVSHTRKNHALEHATITLLSKALPGRRFSGLSLPTGYWILGLAELDDVRKAAEAGLARLAIGESRLAVHPNCGTNIAVTALLAAAASMASLRLNMDDDGNISDSDTFACLVKGGLVGAFAGRPLGPKAQKYVTTDANVHGLSITGITCHLLRNFTAVYIETALETAEEPEPVAESVAEPAAEKEANA